MPSEKILPITWKEWDLGGDHDVIFMDVIFTEDFFPFYKGDKLSNLTFSPSEGRIYESDDNGKVVRETLIRLIPGAHYG